MIATIDERVMVVVPAADVRPDEPRWWCEDGERIGTDVSHVHPDELHDLTPADVRDVEPSTTWPEYAIVCRLPASLSAEAHAMLHDSIACVVGLLGAGEPVYSLTPAGPGRMRVALNVTFDAAALDRFARELARPVTAAQAIADACGDGSPVGWRR